MARDFDLSDVLSITAGTLVSTRHMEDVYDILNFMTGESLYTHALPRACESCRPVLLAQHPQLRDVDAEGIGPDNWKPWLEALYEKFGHTLSVEPCLPGAYEACSPLSEPILDGKKVITVVVTDGNQGA